MSGESLAADLLRPLRTATLVDDAICFWGPGDAS